jgi:hypothetical protein
VDTLNDEVNKKKHKKISFLKNCKGLITNVLGVVNNFVRKPFAQNTGI